MTGTPPLPVDDAPSELAANLYRLVREYPDVPLAWLAPALRAGRGAVAAEWSGLVERGWVRETAEESAGRSAVEAEAVAAVAAERHAAAAHADAALRRGADDVVRATVGDYLAGRRRATTGSGVEVVTTLEETRARLTDLLACSAVNRTLQRARGTEAAAEIGLPQDLAALERGHQDISVLQSDAVRVAWMPRHAKALSEAGAELWRADTVPLDLKVYDVGGSSTAVVPRDPLDLHRGCVIVHAAALVDPLRELFDRCLATARPLAGPPAQDRRSEIVGLMSRGLTDQAIAVRLGVSLRTVSREVVGLMREHGASSRFQLGLLLGDGRSTPRGSS